VSKLASVLKKQCFFVVLSELTGVQSCEPVEVARFLSRSAGSTVVVDEAHKEMGVGQPVVHFEIGCRDREKSAAFYTELFGWTGTPAGPATMISTKSEQGIQGHISSLGHEPHHYTIFYVQVDDIPAALAKAESLGARTIVPLVTLPSGAFAWFADPDGNTVGLWKATIA
jgi:predicted enzyme related to lactoylglutathione lyase